MLVFDLLYYNLLRDVFFGKLVGLFSALHLRLKLFRSSPCSILVSELESNQTYLLLKAENYHVVSKALYRNKPVKCFSLAVIKLLPELKFQIILALSS